MNFENRRIKLMGTMEDRSIVVLFSGNQVMRSEDEEFPFDVNRSFYYFTGLDREGMILLMHKVNGQVSTTLFIPPYDELLAKWVGGRMRFNEAAEISGITDVCDVAEFDEYIANLYNAERSFGHLHFGLDLWRYTANQLPSEGISFANTLQTKYPCVEIEDIYGKIAALRMIKDEEEILEISKAIAITQKGVESMMYNIRPNMNEMVVEGIFDFALMQRGCNKHAFKTIAASGMRATTLHYSDNNQVAKDGELFLCDLGATSNYYCADISRTFPVNGKFTDRQKEIYNTVLNAQKIVEKNAKPGVTLRQLNNMVRDYYAEVLPTLGLNKGVSEYYFHGVSHQLGLDTHDVTDSRKGGVLEPGMVISNEPGLYIADEGIGIRIEDDLYITDHGCVDLAKNIIKEVDDIEKLMQHNR